MQAADYSERTKMRFWSKVQTGRVDDCWEWQASTTGPGYGQIWVPEAAVQLAMAHRVAYELLVGPIPAGLDIDHLCRNRACVNPDHLEPVTPRENILRGNSLPALNAKKTHCPQGHPLSGENLYHDPRGKRGCKACRFDQFKRHKQAQREAGARARAARRLREESA